MTDRPSRMSPWRVAVVFVVAALVAAGCGTTAPQLTQVDGRSARGTAGLDESAGGPDAGPVEGAEQAQGGTQGSGPQGPGTRAATPGQASSANTVRPGTAGTVPSSAFSCNIAEKGPGWDAKNVYVGAAIQSDAAEAGESVGFSGFDFGDQKAITEAAINDTNAKGGLCGRTVVPVFYDVDSLSSANQEAQAACTKWTQDQRVISASLVPNINIPNMYACLSKAKIPIVTVSGSAFLRSGVAPYMPYLLLRNGLSWDRMIGFWLDRLTAMGYFGGWDTATGSPGSAPVKVAILFQEDAIARPAWEALRKAVEQRGFPVVHFVASSDPTSMSSHVLKFKTDGVTHLFIDRLSGLFYPSQAEGQTYRARYALTSQNFIQPFLANGAAPQQLRGAMGVGWHPHLDVAQAQDPGPTPGFAPCMDIMRRAGIDVSKRNYQFTTTAACDGALLARQAVFDGGGVAPENLISGYQTAASKIPVANVFGLAARPGESGLLSTARDLLYDNACSCMRYNGPNLQIP